MPDYSKGVIYQLFSDYTDQVYIGSTVNKLPKRLYGHKAKFERWLEGQYHYCSSFSLFQYPDVKIMLLETYPCLNKNELFARERYWINKTEKCVNICKNPGLVLEKGKKEYWKENNKEYYVENHDKILAKHKDYYEKNHSKILAKSKDYREKNRDKITEQTDCDCGGSYLYKHKARHFKTIIHQNYIKSL